MHGCGQIGWRHVLAGTLAAAAAGCPATTAAADYAVVGNGDGGSCVDTKCDSIRAALEVAKGADTILVPSGDYALDPKLGPLEVTNAVSIKGAGADRTTVHPNGGFTVFVTDSPSAVIAHLTVAGGSSQGEGGNIYNAGNLLLDHVRVTGGSAGSGGGVANHDGTLVIDHGLLDGNHADDEGGAVYDYGIEIGGSLSIGDSTIAGNSALAGGGLATAGSGYARAMLERATVARNHAGRLGGGIYAGADGGSVEATGTIVALNTAPASAPRAAAAMTPSPAALDFESDCAGPVAGDGTNLEGIQGGCDFASAGDPKLSDQLQALGGETPVLALAPASPAVGLAGGDCGGTDQRDIPRPQGPACDAGAYELAAPPSVDATTGGASPSFTFSSPGIDAFECSLDGGAWQPCTSPHTYTELTNGEHVFSVRVPGGEPETEAFTVSSPAPAPRAPAQTPAPPPTPTPTSPPPPPQYHRNVVLRPVAGTVKVRLPGSRRYVALDGAQNVPLGSSIDVRHGRIRLTSARSRSGRTQAATFYSGVFKVTQRGSYTELRLGGPPVVCSSRTSASAARKKKRHKHTRRLWGRGSGHFRTRGQYSAATVRGTTWLVQDSCAGTLTRVVRGVVAVRDRVRHRTILLRAHRRYLARPRRR